MIVLALVVMVILKKIVLVLSVLMLGSCGLHVAGRVVN